jgi:hypothetical protein
VARYTRTGLEGYGVKRAGSFANKVLPGGPHLVGKLTRVGVEGYGVKRAGLFTGKFQSEIALEQQDVALFFGVKREATLFGSLAAREPPDVAVFLSELRIVPWRPPSIIVLEEQRISEVVGQSWVTPEEVEG